jgi:hypothetical protein
MFLGYQNKKIVLTANTRAELENTPCMTFDRIEETDVNYTLYNGEYLTPAEVEGKQKEARKKELIAELDALDLKQIRSLAAKAAGTATDEDLAILADLEEQKAIKRNELKELQEAE